MRIHRYLPWLLAMLLLGTALAGQPIDKDFQGTWVADNKSGSTAGQTLTMMVTADRVIFRSGKLTQSVPVWVQDSSGSSTTLVYERRGNRQETIRLTKAGSKRLRVNASYTSEYTPYIWVKK